MSVVASGCLGDDDDGGGNREAQEEQLQSMVLTGEDVASFGLVSPGAGTFATNEESAQNTSDPEETLNRFETWGRQLGYSVSFIPDPQNSGLPTFLGLRSDASLYEDDRGCRLSFEYDVDLSREANWETSFPELSEVEATEVEAPSVGDEAYWLRVSGITDDGANLFVIDQVVIRQGNVRAFLRVDSQFLADAARNSGEGQVLFWAQTMSDRIEGAAAE